MTIESGDTTNKSDVITADGSGDSINSGNGSDVVDGGFGDDTIYGGNGQDMLFGGWGSDQLYGGNGMDMVYGGAGNDYINSRSDGTSTSDNGVDTIYGDGYDGVKRNIDGSIDLSTGGMVLGSYDENGTFFEGTTLAVGDDLIYAGNGAEFIYGDNGDNASSGGADTIYAGNGNDRLFGEGGNDILVGELGADTLTGGTGNDVFLYNASAESNAITTDTITDLGNGDDVIRIAGADFLSAPTAGDGTTVAANQVEVSSSSDGTTTLYIGTDATPGADIVIKLGGTFEASQFSVHGTDIGLGHPPVAADDVAQALEDGGAVVIDVLANDTDADSGDTKKITAIDTTGTVGLVTIINEGTNVSYDPGGNFQSFGAGETATDTFVYTVSDGSGKTATATVTVTITGTNDGPLITSSEQVGAVTEAPDREEPATGEFPPPDSTIPHTASGTVTFSDVDTSDTHSASYTAAGSDYLGNFSLGALDETTHSVAWDFSVDDIAIDSLQAGQKVIQTYTVAVDDHNGGTASQEVSITITGANDAPVINTLSKIGSFLEIFDGVPEENTAVHEAGGQIGFSDVDILDVHTATAVPMESGYLGMFELDAEDSFQVTGQEIGWHFSVSDGELDKLAAGETLNQIYTIAVDDGYNGIASQDLRITINGTNDAPVIESAFTNAAAMVTEIADMPTGLDPDADPDGDGVPNGVDNAPFIANPDQLDQDGDFVADVADIEPLNPLVGQENASTHTRTSSIGFSDVDLSDTHSVTFASPNGGVGYLGSFSLDAVDQVSNNVGWRFSVSDSALDSLSDGQTLIQKYDVTVLDGHGGNAVQAVIITITGTDDAPIIGGQTSGSVTEDIVTSASGTLTINDADIGQSSFQAQSGLAGTYGTLNINTAGTWNYFLNNSLAPVQALSEGETLSDTVNVLTADGTQQAIEITINGRNEISNKVGYYSMLAGQGVGAQIDEITIAGYTPVNITVPNASQITGLAALYVNNENNNGFGGEFLANLTSVWNAVADGMTLIIHDRAVTNATSILPGIGSQFTILRDFSDSASANLNADAGSKIATGPGGTINDASLDGGNATSHGYIAVNSLPDSAEIFLNRDLNSERAITIGYEYGDGYVIYSTIPLDFYTGSNFFGFGITNAEANTYAANVIAFGAGRAFGTISPNDPIIFDLNGDGFQFTNGDASFLFDLDADGVAEPTVWASHDDGVLVMDLDGSGAIENGSEVLSNQFTGFGFGSSMEALRSLDANVDGSVDARDALFADLRLWHDNNGDGLTQAGELLALDGFGISAISVVEEMRNETIEGQHVYASGTFSYANGTNGEYVAVQLSQPVAANTESGIVQFDPASNSIDDAAGIFGGESDDMLSGDAVDNNLVGSGGNDILIGGGGSDMLTGGTGADQFVYKSINDVTDTITDFNAAEGDVLDIRDVLVGYSDASNIDDFVKLQDNGSSTTVMVNPDGMDPDAVPLVVLQEVTGVLASELLSQHNLVVA